MPEAYTSTVVAPGQIVLGVVTGAVVALVVEALRPGLWPFAVVAFVVIVATGIYLAVVRLTVTADRVTISQGRGEREPRAIHAGEIAQRSAAVLSWPQCFGVGVPTAFRTTRLSVRPGPTLCLTLTDGELVRISTPDPQAALRILSGAGTGTGA